MYSIAHMTAQGYRFGAPKRQAEEIDARIAEEQPCPRCGGLMHYEGYHREGEYIALAVCNRCGYELAF